MANALESGFLFLLPGRGGKRRRKGILEKNQNSRLLSAAKHVKITNRDILDTSLLPAWQEARDHKEVKA